MEYPFGPTPEFKDRFFGSQEERQVWFRTQQIASGQAEVREWLRFNDPNVQLSRSGGPLYAIYDLGLDTAGAVRIAFSPKFPTTFWSPLITISQLLLSLYAGLDSTCHRKDEIR